MTETQMWEAVRLLDGQTLTTVKGVNNHPKLEEKSH